MKGVFLYIIKEIFTSFCELLFNNFHKYLSSQSDLAWDTPQIYYKKAMYLLLFYFLWTPNPGFLESIQSLPVYKSFSVLWTEQNPVYLLIKNNFFLVYYQGLCFVSFILFLGAQLYIFTGCILIVYHMCTLQSDWMIHRWNLKCWSQK